MPMADFIFSIIEINKMYKITILYKVRH